MPFKISPSLIARYFFHDCERFLRYRATPDDLAGADGVPLRQDDASPVMQAIRDRGYEWEREVVTRRLEGKVEIAEGDGDPDPIHRYFGWEQTQQLLRSVPAGRAIYQPTLRPPARFYAQVGLDPALVIFGANRPDLLRVLPREGGGRLIRVVDVKRAAALKLMHRVQVLLYALQLEAIVADLGIADTSVDLHVGEVWLGDLEKPRPFDLELVRRPVEQLLRHDLPRVLRNPAEDAFWHLYFRCEWCEYFDHCAGEMRREDNVSRIANLSPRGKRFLLGLPIVTVPQLGDLFAAPDGMRRLDACPSLRGRTHGLAKQVEALRSSRPQPTGGASFAFPRHEHIRLLLTVQAEPLHGVTYLAGLLVNTYPDKAQAIFATTTFKPFVRIAASARPPDVARFRAEFIEYLYAVLERVDAYNRRQNQRDPVTLQVYVWSNRERELLVGMLLEALDDPGVADKAATLLLFLQGPDLLLTDQHPEAKVPLPAVVVLSTLGQLLALPIEVSYQLSKVEDTLLPPGRSRNYKPDARFDYPLGHGLRPELVHAGWASGDRADLDAVRWRAGSLLFALLNVVQQAREWTKADLATTLPFFALDNPINVRDPLLSRLVFLAEYESVLSCREIRDSRGEPRPVQLQNESAVELATIASGATYTDCRVREGQSVELEDEYPNWLLVSDTPDGRREQLLFNDYRYRRYLPRDFSNRHLGVGSLHTLTRDAEGFTQTLRIDFGNRGRAFAAGQQPKPGDHLVLLRRFSDINTAPVSGYLRRLDRTGPRTFLTLLRSPEQLAGEHLLPSGVRDRAESQVSALGLLPSQESVYSQVRRQRVMGLWGPPGTGKTHFLATVVLGLARASREAGRPFRVWVTAYTHVAIENVLRKIVSQATELGIELPPLAKVRRWESPTPPGAQIAVLQSYKDVVPWLDGSDPGTSVCVVGATVYAALMETPSFRGVDHFESRFDLVIVDEASQVPVGVAALPVNGATAEGRVILAGDHLQLPPVIKGVYPPPPEGHPPLHRSIFEVAQRASERSPALSARLTDNFRMNDVLTSITAASLYGSSYRCANPEIAQRRLRLGAAAESPAWIDACLRPSHPLVIVLEEDLPLGTSSPLEAALVAEAVRALRQRLLDGSGQPYPPGPGGQKPFYEKGVFIVSPHHEQIRHIRRAVRGTTGDPEPFVDTVDKMQGQEADAALVSYGVSDPEHAAAEGEFLYNVNRLNVAITRARCKTILFLPRPLLDALPQVLDVPEAERGLAYMQGIVRLAQASGETSHHLAAAPGGTVRLTVIATARAVPVTEERPLAGRLPRR